MQGPPLLASGQQGPAPASVRPPRRRRQEAQPAEGQRGQAGTEEVRGPCHPVAQKGRYTPRRGQLRKGRKGLSAGEAEPLKSPGP
eukprot:9494353-Pyramimonas_sp.AAC.1